MAVNIVKTFPVTNDPCGRTLYGLVANQDEDQVVAKVDYQISPKQSIFGRFMLGRLNQGSTYDGTNPLSINTYGFQDFDYGVNIGHTYLIGNNIVNSLRLAANRTNIVKITRQLQELGRLWSEHYSAGWKHHRHRGDRRVH